MTARLLPITVLGFFLLLDVTPARAGSYARLSSSETQLGEASPKVVILKNDDMLGVGITNVRGSIMFRVSGTYFVAAAGQVGSTDGKGEGDVRLWFRHNGKDIANSNTDQTVFPGFTGKLLCHRLVEINAGDKLEVAFSVRARSEDSPAENVGLIASRPKDEPAVPSMVFAAFKIDDTAYAQLSSTESQPAQTTPTKISLNQTESIKGIENENGVVTFKNAGAYFVMASGRLGSQGKESGKIRVWMKRNGSNVANSNTEQAIGSFGSGDIENLVCQQVVECKAGDKVEFVQSSTSANDVGLLGFRPTDAEQSMKVSIVKITDTFYAQLSSSKSQVATDGKTVTLDQTNKSNGINNGDGIVTVKKTGFYFVSAAGEAGNSKGTDKGYVRVWLRKNAKDVNNSSTEQTIDRDYAAVQVGLGIIEIKTGDTFQLVRSGQGSGVGIVASKPRAEAAVPSMNVSLFKLD